MALLRPMNDLLLTEVYHLHHVSLREISWNSNT